jgi:hypothetical protein
VKNNARKTIQGELFETIRLPLTAAGFTDITKQGAFRYLDDRVDVIEIQFAGRGTRVPYGSTWNTFRIEAGVFFRFAPHPMGAAIKGKLSLPLDNVADCHFRTLSNPSLLLRNYSDGSQWHVDFWSLRRRFILADVRKNLDAYLIPWFDKFGNLDKVYEYLKVDHSGHKQDTRRTADSWGWLYSQQQVLLAAFFKTKIKT